MSTFGRRGFFALFRKFWLFLEMPKMRNANSNMAFWHFPGKCFFARFSHFVPVETANRRRGKRPWGHCILRSGPSGLPAGTPLRRGPGRGKRRASICLVLTAPAIPWRHQAPCSHHITQASQFCGTHPWTGQNNSFPGLSNPENHILLLADMIAR